MSQKIHPTSVISPDAEIGPDVEIGPYCLIQGKIKIGRGTYIEGHATVGCRSSIIVIGENNHIAPGAVIGGPPQDISYKGEPTRLIIGNHNVFREFSCDPFCFYYPLRICPGRDDAGQLGATCVC